MKGLHKGKKHRFFLGLLALETLLVLGLPLCLNANGDTSRAIYPKAFVSVASDFIGKDADFMCLDMETGPNGYVYMATNEGIKRFDGTHLINLHHTYDNPNLLYDALFKDANGDVWFAGRTGFSTLRGDSLEPFELPLPVLKRCNIGVEGIYMDSSGTLYVAPRHRGYYVVTPDGAFKNPVSDASGINGFVVKELPDGSLFHFSALPKTESPDSIGVYFMDKNDELELLTTTSYNTKRYESSLVEYADGTHTLSLGNKDIVRFKDDSLVSHQRFDHMVIKLFVDRNDDLWIGTLDHGFFRVKNHDLKNAQGYWDNACAVVTEDRSGGLWVKSDSLSFGYISQPSIAHYSSATNTSHFENAKWLLNSGESALCLAPPRGIYTLDSSLSYIPIPFNRHEEGTRKTDINPTTAHFDTLSNKLWLGFRGKLGSWDGNEWKYYPLSPDTFQNPHIIALTTLADGSLMGSTQRRVFSLKNERVVSISNTSTLNFANITTSSDGNVWVTRRDGLWTLRDGIISRPSDMTPAESSRIYWSTAYALGCLWLQPVEGKQLLKLQANGLEPVYDQDGNPVSLCNNSIAPNGDMWGASCEPAITGVYHFFREGTEIKVEQFAFADEAGRLRLNKLFLVTKEAIYWASQFGLFTQKIEQLVPENRTSLTRISGIRINHKHRALQSFFQLEPSENYLNISFNAINFRNNLMEFRYRLVGLDSSWVTTKYGQAQFTNLPSGDYQFEVQSHGAKGTNRWSEPAFLSFHIETPFWETIWFRICAGLALLVSVISLFRIRSAQIRRKESAKAQVAIDMARLELRALKAQVNPHFIFNAMSSVSYYLSTRRSDEAENYLQRFSKLVRIILENSEKSAVGLDDEVDLMRHYVSLESERFKGDDIELKVSYQDIDAKHVFVPPAIFQPYVENAIWHGLKNKDGDRLIKMSFHSIDSTIQVTIEDNGIGREASKNLVSKRTRQHRSFGMMIASRRLEVLNKKNAASLEVKDLYSELGKPSGTRISFYLPLITKQPEDELVETSDYYQS